MIETEKISTAWLMSGDISKTLNLLLTSVMLVVVLIACQKTPESRSEPENLPLQSHQQSLINIKYR